MASYDQFRGILGTIVQYLKQIASHTNDSACCAASTSAGLNSSIPVGFSSIAIVQTSSGGTVDIHMSDGTIFTLQVQGEVLVHAAGNNKYLPAYTITTSDGGAWKWSAVK